MRKDKNNDYKEINKSIKIAKYFLLSIIIFLFILSIIEYNDYVENKYIIQKTKPIIYEVLESYDKAKSSPRLIVLFNKSKYEVVILKSEYNNLKKTKPKLYFNNKQNKLISYHELSTYEDGFYGIFALVVLLIFPYKKFAFFIMKIKPIHNYIKETEPKIYGLYLDTINKKRSLK